MAERLFNLPPSFMPLQDKFSLAESLWNALAPTSTKDLLIGAKTLSTEISIALDDYAKDIALHWELPSEMQQRFKWLSGGDVEVNEKLNRHLREINRDVAVDHAKDAIPALMNVINSLPSNQVGLASHAITIGKHKIRVHLELGYEGIQEVSESEIRQRQEPPAEFEGGIDWWGWVDTVVPILILVGLFYMFYVNM